MICNAGYGHGHADSPLRLNEDLTEAISLGHDLGHTPFGHAGERALNSIMTDGFRHFQQSVRVVDLLENDGQGLNLTYEVRNGILCHTSGTPAQTLEGRIVRIADRVAYIITISMMRFVPAFSRKAMCRRRRIVFWATGVPPGSTRLLNPLLKTAGMISGWHRISLHAFSGCMILCMKRCIEIRWPKVRKQG